MSLLNRTKSYFFLICVLMCGFLTLLTWHMVYGTFHLSYLSGSKSTTLTKQTTPTAGRKPGIQLEHLAVDKLSSRKLPVFEKDLSESVVKKHHPDTNSDFSIPPIQSASSNKTASKAESINYINELHISKSEKFLKSSNKNVSKTSNVNDVNEVANQKLQHKNPSTAKANQKLQYKTPSTGKDNEPIRGSKRIKTVNQSVIIEKIQVHPELKTNIDNVWNFYKKATDSLKIKLQNGSQLKNVSLKNNVNTFSHKTSINESISSAKNKKIQQNDHPVFSNNRKDDKDMLELENKEVQVNEKMVIQNSSESGNRTVKSYTHAALDQDKLALLKKKYPWLVLSNIEHSRTTFRPDICTNCFTPNFPVNIEQKVKCKTWNSGKIDLLILIFSAPSNVEVREVIRNTWGKKCRDSRSSTMCLFVIGLSLDRAENNRIKIENALNSDILQVAFKDSYANLTYKTMFSLKWAEKNCYNVKYVMKTDDDMYVNTELIPFMLQAAPKSHFMGGHCWGSSRPNRDSFSKWFVPLTSFKRERFPPMCSGTGYVMSMDVVKSILFTSRNIPFFHLEDVYIALCLQQLGIIPINLMGFSNMFQEFDACRYRNEVLTSHQVPVQYLRLYWEDVEQCPLVNVLPKQLYIPMPYAYVD